VPEDIYYQAADLLLDALGAPRTAAGVNMLVAWSLAEWGGTPDLSITNNPLATEYPKTAAGVVGNWNPQGVLMFDTLAHGAAACAAEMQNGLFPALVAALRAGDPGGFFSAEGLRELAVWAGGQGNPNYGYASNILSIYQGLPPPPAWALSTGAPSASQGLLQSVGPSVGLGLLFLGAAAAIAFGIAEETGWLPRELARIGRAVT
jgi:hypothetical protein